jgi:serine/threonine-protein kinase
LPACLVPVVRRATAADPAARWPSAAALGAALAAAAAELPVAAVSARAAARPSRLGAPRESSLGALPPEEQSWQRAVALVLAGATAVALYALLVSVTPRTLDAGDALPFVTFGAEPRPGGRVFTRARFETWPVLAAAGAIALALAAYGLIRRHWRHAGVDRPTPERPLPATRPLLVLAAIIVAVFFIRIALDRAGATQASSYVPVLGGVLELGVVYLFWMGVLDGRRTGRGLGREPLFWLALGLSLFPPVMSFARMLAGRAP